MRKTEGSSSLTRLATALGIVLALAIAAPGAAGAGARSSDQIPAMLVFERGGDIYRMTVDGSETVRLTATKAWEGEPAVSPDGLEVAYARGPDSYGTSIWTMGITGDRQARITGGLPHTDPTWSPDGETIYFARAFPNRFDEDCFSIFRIGADGRRLARVTRGMASHFQPAASPDGARIAFTRATLCAGGGAELYLSAVDSSGRPTNDFRRLGGDFWDPTWSPDGTKVAFSTPNGTLGVFVARRDGSGLRRVTPRSLQAEAPAWSPDGEWIAFAARTRSRSSDLYLIHPDGTRLVRVTATKAEEHTPAWLRRT